MQESTISAVIFFSGEKIQREDKNVWRERTSKQLIQFCVLVTHLVRCAFNFNKRNKVPVLTVQA